MKMRIKNYLRGFPIQFHTINLDTLNSKYMTHISSSSKQCSLNVSQSLKSFVRVLKQAYVYIPRQRNNKKIIMP